MNFLSFLYLNALDFRNYKIISDGYKIFPELKNNRHHSCSLECKPDGTFYIL